MIHLLFWWAEFHHPPSGLLRLRRDLKDVRSDEQKLRWHSAVVDAAWRLRKR
jgi:hypothetical protein